MSQPTKKIITTVGAVLLAAVTAYGATCVAATNSKPLPLTPPPGPKPMQLMPAHQKPMRVVVVRKKHHGRSIAGTWRRAMHQGKNLSKSDARTLTQAAILLYGNKDMKVSNIQTVANKRGRKFYRIAIVNNNTKMQKIVVMNANNGRMLPLRKARRMKLLAPAKD